MSNATRVATYRAKQLSLRTAQARRLEELEAALRAAEDMYQRGIFFMTDEEIANVHTLRVGNHIRRLSGGTKSLSVSNGATRRTKAIFVAVGALVA